MTSSNTKKTFQNKWEKNPKAFFSETLDENSEIFKWILKRNGFNCGDELRKHLSTRRRILDAGCGNGRVTALLRLYSDPGKTPILGIDITSINVAKQNLSSYENIILLERDIVDDLADLGTFDFIYCQEVLHHTNNPRRAFLNLCELLVPNGEIAIYVYKKKAPVREFVDDYVRAKISTMEYEDAMEHCGQLTDLGQRLHQLNIKIHVPRIDVLGIEAGEYDLQRFLYHFFVKCFWNPDLSFHDNTVVNYDWYHPQESSRHEIEEVRNWFTDGHIHIIHEYIDFYGITIRGIKEGEKNNL